METIGPVAQQRANHWLNAVTGWNESKDPLERFSVMKACLSPVRGAQIEGDPLRIDREATREITQFDPSSPTGQMTLRLSFTKQSGVQ